MSFRRDRLTRPIFRWAKTALPRISATEARAIEAGTVWWDGELFGGQPDWDKLLAMAPSRLTEEEQRFLDGPVEELCTLVDDWTVTWRDRDMRPEAWACMREHRFFGMVIPKRYGGLGFSNAAHSEVVRKISSASVVAGVTVMVPNSLGPGELMLHFGTEAQREHWLPRLADGREIPCFALTSADAGSDAGAMRDRGVVCWGEHEGRAKLGLRLTFAKRYITLAPIATVMGLAFKLEDPDRLLGGPVERGITVALVPMATPGIRRGARHVAQFTFFQNGPVEGTDVFVPLDAILGGEARIGEGWSMLMTALASGRGISLPSQAAAVCAHSARVTGAYARVRSQFGGPIGQFEGIQEALAELAANAYQVDAARRLTVAALDEGHRPAVVSAIMKANATERMRQSVNLAMDVLGGKAVIDGPANPIAAHYRAVPIGITVEGANILIRNLMIFGQGAIRAHPFMLNEMRALADPDEATGLAAFDRRFWRHLGHSLRIAALTIVTGWTGGLAAPRPIGTSFGSHWRQMSRFCAAFATLTDLCLLTMAGTLKRREMISARMGDILSELYLLGATLKRFECDGRPEADRPLVEYVMQRGFNRIGHAFGGVIANMPARWAAMAARIMMFPLGVPMRPPSDELVRETAAILLEPSSQRDRLTPNLAYGGSEGDNPARLLEVALQLVSDAALVLRRVDGKRRDGDTLLRDGAITAEEHDLLRRRDEAVARVIAVDSLPASSVSPLHAQHDSPASERREAAE